jgi:RNA polymerase sigma-70 factor, ECF subfamily
VTRADRERLRGWLAAIADGDRAAFDPLFAALWPLVNAYAARLLADPSLAEDVAQEVLVRVFTRAGEYDAERDALAWILGVATWECRTARRRRGRRAETPIAAAPDVPDGAALDPSQRDLVRAAIAAVAELAPADAATIAAAIFDDAEARAGLAPATFRKRLERALARLRATWRSRHGAL